MRCSHFCVARYSVKMMTRSFVHAGFPDARDRKHQPRSFSTRIAAFASERFAAVADHFRRRSRIAASSGSSVCVARRDEDRLFRRVVELVVEREVVVGFVVRDAHAFGVGRALGARHRERSHVRVERRRKSGG
jgi:hypothetical protein